MGEVSRLVNRSFGVGDLPCWTTESRYLQSHGFIFGRRDSHGNRSGIGWETAFRIRPVYSLRRCDYMRRSSLSAIGTGAILRYRWMVGDTTNFLLPQAVEGVLWWSAKIVTIYQARRCGAKICQTKGLSRRLGQGVPKDDGQAAVWYSSAAHQGNPFAQTILGWLYESGRGVTQDFPLAALWFRKAAEQGHAEVQNHLGVPYAKGQGVPKDYGQAAAWYLKAAEQGHAYAQNNLGRAIRQWSRRRAK